MKEIENSVVNAIREAIYDPEAEIKLSDSLINDLGIDSLEMQVIFSQLGSEYGVVASLKNILSSINDAIDSADSSTEDYSRAILESITKNVGLSFREEDADDLRKRDLLNESRNLSIRYITEYITVKSLVDCITFLRGRRDG